MSTFRPAVGVVGASRFGICLAEIAARNGHDVILYTSIPQRATALRRFRRLPTRLPELDRLHDRVTITTDPEELAAGATLILFALSRDYLGRIMGLLSGSLDGAHYVVHAVHTLEGEELFRASEVIRQNSAVKQVGAIAGPAHVNELLSGRPNAAVIGTSFPSIASSVRSALESSFFKIYEDTDMRGVELAAALGQVVAIAVGMVDGARLGAAAYAAVLTQGLKECTEVGLKLGATERTFSGLAGVGRLADALRRGEPNYQLGLDIGRGLPAEGCISSAPGEAMGIRVAWNTDGFARRLRLSMPLFNAVSDILDGEVGVAEGIESALARARER